MAERNPIQLDKLMLIRADEAFPDHSTLAALLNTLYAAETRSLFRYLENWQPYTDARSVRLRTLVRGMTKSSFEHADRLAKLIESIGGVTSVGSFDDYLAQVTYSDWATILPQLIEAKRQIIARYSEIIERVGLLPEGDRIIAELESLNAENARQLIGLESWRAKVTHGRRNGVPPSVGDA